MGPDGWQGKGQFSGEPRADAVVGIRHFQLYPEGAGVGICDRGDKADPAFGDVAIDKGNLAWFANFNRSDVALGSGSDCEDRVEVDNRGNIVARFDVITFLDVTRLENAAKRCFGRGA